MTVRPLAAVAAAAACLAVPASAVAARLAGHSAQSEKAAKGAPAGTPTPAPTATPTPAGHAGKPDAKTPPAGTGADHGAGQGGAGAPVTALPPAAAPRAGERVAAVPAAGVVKVKLPGTDSYVPLEQAASMPVGSRIDARHGEVVLTAALPGAGAEAGTFSGGQFVVRQDTHVTVLRLVGGDFAKCAERTLAAARPRKRIVVRSLWGSDHGGHFQTHGHNSVATVRGTRWLTEDRCDGTLTRVTAGAVSVRDRRARRTVLVTAGHSYLARRHPR